MELVKNIAEKLSVEAPDFSNCINVVKHDLKITGIETTIRFHYLKFDGNKKPMVKAIAENRLSDLSKLTCGFLAEYRGWASYCGGCTGMTGGAADTGFPCGSLPAPAGMVMFLSSESILFSPLFDDSYHHKNKPKYEARYVKQPTDW